MGKDHGRKEAEQRAREQEIRAQAAITTASQPTPLQARLEADDLQFLNDTTSPTFDITKTAAMNPYLSQYNNAVANRDEDRAGTGAIRLGANGQNPNIAASQNRLNDERRRERAGGALENAFRMKNAEVLGSAMPLIQTDVNRNLTLAGMQNQNSQNAWERYWQQRNQPSGLAQFGAAALGGGLGAFGSWLGRPRAPSAPGG